MDDDPYLDIVELVREKFLKNSKILEDFERHDFFQVYLFFDYDGHATQAGDDKIERMLELFDNETESGKLYISYPMIEAYKDTTDDFQNHCVPARKNIRYKKLLTTNYADPKKVTAADWCQIVVRHLKKGNFIVNGVYEAPSSISRQDEIFDAQVSKFINTEESCVGVLSGVPFFIVEYFGGLPASLTGRDQLMDVSEI